MTLLMTVNVPLSAADPVLVPQAQVSEKTVAIDCLGVVGGDAVLDECGVCDGPGPDQCGICDGDGTSCLDCFGVPFGEAEMGVCGCNDDTSCFCDGPQAEFECPGSLTQKICLEVEFDASQFAIGGDGLIFDRNFYADELGAIQEVVNDQSWDMSEFSWWYLLVGPQADAQGFFLGNFCRQGTQICGCQRLDGCYAPDTKIQMHDKTLKLARNLRAGDKLWNPVLKKEVVVEQVIEGPEALPLIEFEFDEGSLRVSQDHPMLVRPVNTVSTVSLRTHSNTLALDRGLVIQAKDVSKGEQIMRSDGSWVSIKEIRRLSVDEGQYVVNFILQASDNDYQEHFILADGIVSGDLVLQGALAMTEEAGKKALQVN